MKLFFAFASLLAAFASESLADKCLYKEGHCVASITNVFLDLVLKKFQAVLNPGYMDSQSISYDLYTPENMNERQILRTGDVEALRNSNFNPSWPVRFLIHGWTGKSTSCSNAAIKDAYLSRGAFNVILVDWRDIAFNINYPWLEKQFPKIAAEMAKFIKFLQKELNIDMTQIYLIGHSAGSHIAGLIGKNLKPQKLGAIVALDPALLIQFDVPANLRLAPDDALYVESIHTDIYNLGNPSVELSQASFFPNWGQGQPHCPNATAAELRFACDHFAAVYYFAESIREPNSFGAVKCPNFASIWKSNKCKCSSGNYNKCQADVYMGGEPVVPKTGIFYLSTKRYSPYGLKDTVHRLKVKPPNFFK